VNIFQVDSFTGPFAGNPAGVVLGAEELSDSQMQAIARELNNSETAFVMEADADDHEVRIRFFTPTVEVPSCGHATIAAH
jgi:PhzF family phenazine biosynthesis protein